MVIDTSALITILRQEPEALAFATAISNDPTRLVSATTLVEATMVAEGRLGPEAGWRLNQLIERAKVSIVAFDADQAEVARRAWRTFGKGRHPAGLNFGDCCAYALSVTSGEPLLFKGDDFARTDVVAVALPG